MAELNFKMFSEFSSRRLEFFDSVVKDQMLKYSHH